MVTTQLYKFVLVFTLEKHSTENLLLPATVRWFVKAGRIGELTFYVQNLESFIWFQFSYV